MKIATSVALMSLALSGTEAFSTMRGASSVSSPTSTSTQTRATNPRTTRRRSYRTDPNKLPYDRKKNDGRTNVQPTQRLDFTTDKGNERMSVRSSVPRKDNHDRDSNYNWLHWLSKQVGESDTVGRLDARQIDQIPRVIAAWSKKGTVTAARQAQSLLKRFIDEQLAGNPYAEVDVKSFNCVMSAWERTGVADATDKVQSLIGCIRKLRQERPDKFGDLRADVITYSVFAKTWAKSRDPQAVDKAMGILSIMEENDLGPNTHTYNAVLLALVHSENVHKAVIVKEIIERMNRRAANGHGECSPDIYSYQSLIAAWSRTPLAGTAPKAEQVLNFLDKLGNSTRPDLKPNVHCYTAAIHAWAHSMERNKARRAYHIFHHMREVAKIQPTTVAYTAVLNACKSPAEDFECEHAFQVARLVMEELRWDPEARPNFLTYSTFLHVIGTTTKPGSEDRNQLTRVTFEEACKDGQVGYIVLEYLRVAASEELYQELLADVMRPDPEDGVQVLHLPYEWTRNVKGERLPSKRYIRFSLEQPVKAKVREELKKVPDDWHTAGPYSKEKEEQWLDGMEDVSFTLEYNFGKTIRGL